MKTVGIRREAHFRSLNFLDPVVAYCLAIFGGRELSDRPSSAERSKSTCKKCQRVCMSLVQSW